MTEDEVHARLQREFETHPHQQLRTLLQGWVPETLADVLADLSPRASQGTGEEERHVHRIQAQERAGLVALLKDFRWTLTGSLPIAAGIVTAGGVSLKEVDPTTFESRKVRGLHIVGELLGSGCRYRRLQSAGGVQHRVSCGCRCCDGKLISAVPEDEDALASC